MDPIRSIQPIGTRVAEVSPALALRPVAPDQRQGREGNAERNRKDRRRDDADESESEDQQPNAQRLRKDWASDDDRAFGDSERLPARRSEDRGEHAGPHIDVSA